MTRKIVRTNTKGFGLVEILILVAVIGILAAIAIPRFGSYRAKGYTSQVKSDIKNSPAPAFFQYR